MDTRILLVLIVCVTLAVCKHTGKKEKHHKHKDIARDLLELRGKHHSHHGGKGKKEREENLMADLGALLAEADEDSEEMQRREESDEMNAAESEDERSEGDSSDDLDKRSEESDDLDLLSALAGRIL